MISVEQTLTVSLALERRECQDTCKIVLFWGISFLREVPDDMIVLFRIVAVFTDDVKKKGVGVVVQRLVVQEELRKQAKTLRIPGRGVQHRDIAIPQSEYIGCIFVCGFFVSCVLDLVCLVIMNKSVVLQC